MKIAEIYKADICVIGGGMAGVCAAVSAARRGARVALVQDRPVLGGNASQEIKMWIRGASGQFPLYREGGLIEEIALRNSYYNPTMSWGVWSGVLYDLVTSEKNIKLYLNASCMGAVEKDSRIQSITAWQLTTYKLIQIEAKQFIDCSGDCILAQFTSAETMRGREDKRRFHEEHAQETADLCTMGNTCMLQARKTDKEISFIPPSFAKKYTDEDFASRVNLDDKMAFTYDNFWWVELGGEQDTLADAEEINRELLASIYGVWDYIKNSGKFDSKTWEIDWVGFLAGKRENVRYVGDYVLTENDLLESKVFPDEVGYGGWTMDDHDPKGFTTRSAPNRHVRIQKPYAIPYRCLYSKNIKNLLFAGRNISVTHMALSSTRVMATCGMLGQAVGNAATIAVREHIEPKDVMGRIDRLKGVLRDEDCYLLHTPRRISDALSSAKHTLDKERYDKLASGIERKTEAGDFCAAFDKGERVEFTFAPIYCKKVRLVLDNDIARESVQDYNLRQYPQKLHIMGEQEEAKIPEVLTKAFDVFVQENGEWTLLAREENNYLRLRTFQVEREITGIAFIGKETYGGEKIKIASFDVVREE